MAGCYFLLVSALIFLLAGLFAICLGLSGRFLPHDEQFLGMTAMELCSLHGCRVVHFMVHDRVSFGGALVAIGTLYLWLVQGPLRARQAWAWWTLALSAVVGFASFFAYIGYGYLDTWHGIATLGLLPCFGIGLARSFPDLTPPRDLRCLLQSAVQPGWNSKCGLGQFSLLATAIGLIGAGLTILGIGMTFVLVPQDVAYMGVTGAELNVLNPRLVPLIAHDRAGFGGAVCCLGIVLLCSVRSGPQSRGRWWALTLAGGVGFGAAIGIHPAVGYDDAVHLAPAVLGAIGYFVGLALIALPVSRRDRLSRSMALSVDSRASTDLV
jgi:hypothetical protein